MNRDQYRYDSSNAFFDPSTGLKQNNVGYGITFERSSKVPLEANRIFSTFEAFESYVNDPNGTAIAGLTYAVIKDPVKENNGLYYLEYDASATNKLSIHKSDTGVTYDASYGLRIDVVEDSSKGVSERYISVNEGVGIHVDSSNNTSIQINNNVLTPSGNANDASCNVQFFEKKDVNGNKDGMAGRMVWSVWED